MTFQQLTHPDDLYLDEAHVGPDAGNNPHYTLEKRYLHKGARSSGPL